MGFKNSSEKMDIFRNTISGETAIVVFLCGLLLGLVFFVFYVCFILRSIIKQKFCKATPEVGVPEPEPIKSAVSPTSLTNDCETESMILILPQNAEDHYHYKRALQPGDVPFFKLPTDKSDSYFKFESVGDLERSRKAYQNGRCSQAIISWHSRRRSRRLSRKRTWDKSTAVHVLENDWNNKEIKLNVSPFETSTAKNTHYFDTIVESHLKLASSCKEVMI